jgi:NAD(P)-dependent dehydrogenase (short-subunit alcohol dehydrogenase family)
MGVARRVFITGGTKGLGRALAYEFGRAGCATFVTGRSLETARAAAASLAAQTLSPAYAGAGDAGSWEDITRLAGEAVQAMGGIDIWVSNAGIPQGEGRVWELEPEDMEAVLRTDLLGPMLAAKAAFATMEGGWLWFVEGHGSDGSIRPGLSAYGTAKRAIGYLWRALSVVAAAAGSALKVGAISPGIMITDFVMQSLAGQSPGRRAQTARIFNILADRPETVAAWLVPRMLAARRGGTRLAWLTGAKIMGRFMFAGIMRRRLVDEAGLAPPHARQP